MNKKMLITGGAGFIGTNAAKYFSKQGCKITVYDNLSRAELLKKKGVFDYNWDYLSKLEGVKLLKEDIRDLDTLFNSIKNVDVILHTAAQTAVMTSIEDPRTDFEVNSFGTFNLLEAARKAGKDTIIIYCSTNKVYGENVNSIRVKEQRKRYFFDEKAFAEGIPETLGVDLCEHTPYGCSKLAGDIYMQDYAKLYNLKTGVFRMSCIYGPRQFGVEDQGWVTWFIIATLLEKRLTIYGDGKQVRDILYIDDLLKAFEAFINSDLKCGVWNMGGGPKYTLSLIELVDLLRKITSKEPEIDFSDWRPGDQKIYISDIRKANFELGWKPTTAPGKGVRKLAQWIEGNRDIFETLFKGKIHGGTAKAKVY